MMQPTTPNSKPLVEYSPDEELKPWLVTAGAMSKFDVTSSSDSEGDDEIDVDKFAACKNVVDVDSFTCYTAATCDESINSGDSVASFGSHQDEHSRELEEEFVQSKTFRGLRSSIKRSSLLAEIPVHTRQSSWKQLPIPDMDKIRRSQTLPTYLKEVTPTATSRRRSVSFQNVCIRSYNQIVGDNPSVSYGPPITLDWAFEELKPIPVDNYEEDRCDRRRQFKHLGLSYVQRMAILQNECGQTEAELKEAIRKADSDKFKRAVTKYFLPVQILEDAAESGVRKAKRYLQRRRHSTV